MITLRITEFPGYTKDLFLEFLRAHPLSFTNVIIPKDFGNDEGLDLQLSDYYRALYIGQLLGRISEDIIHDVPEPDQPGEISFIIATTQWEALADLLVWIYKGCDPKEEDYAAASDFMVAACTFALSLPTNEPLHCPLFLDIINNFYTGNDMEY